MLSKKLRLNKNEVLLVKENSVPYFSKTFTLLVFSSKNVFSPKFGIITSSKFSKKAVVRNKVKRQIFDFVKNNLNDFENNYYVFIPKPKVLEENINIYNEISYLLKKSKTK